MQWNFAAFGMHVTLFPVGIVMILAALLLAGFGMWTLFKFLRAIPRG
jgi:hypothetical protein